MIDDWEAEQDPLAALGRGDPQLFEAFVTREMGSFLAFFRRLGASLTEAEDLTQDLSLKLYRQSQTYRPEGRFAAYTFRVARNLWIDRTRRRGREPRRVGDLRTGEDSGEDLLLSSLPDGSLPEPGHVLEQREEAARLLDALAELSEGHRLVFELGVMQELPYQEIAEILDVPLGTVKSRMFHAVRKLRVALEGPSQEEGPEGQGREDRL